MLNKIDYFFKRLFDTSLAYTGILFSLPLWILFGLLVWVEDKGPTFYVQERIGKDGKAFKVIKFRTMTGPDKKIVAPISKILRKTALDELPQLINIAMGEMSFVGPRPLIREEMEDLKDKHFYEERMKIKPGLTGITQVLLCKNASPEEKCLYDIWYKNNRTFIMDLELICASCLITFLGRWEVDIDKVYVLNRIKKKIDLRAKTKEKNG